MSKIKVLVKEVNVPKLADSLAKAVSVAKAVNSTKIYNGKEKVDKVLTGASTAIDVGLAVWRVFK